MKYSDRLKMNMVSRLSGTDPISAHALSEQVGIPQQTLSRWLREACIANAFPNEDLKGSLATLMSKTPKRPEDWKAEEKLQVVLDAAALSQEELGGFLRSKGLHEAHLKRWRSQMLAGLQKAPSVKKSKGAATENRRLRELERELVRKDKALAETAALLALKKKVREIWGDEDDDIPSKNGP
jgi:transposase-like protein